VVAVESSSPDRSKDYAARLVRALGEGEGPAPTITYRVDPAYFEARGLLYLSVDALTRLRDRLFDYQEFIEAYAAHRPWRGSLEALNQQIANAGPGLPRSRSQWRARGPAPRIRDRPGVRA
jgi:hypothetical protein